MNSNNEIQQVEVSLEAAQDMVAFGDALLRLEQNRDFQRVILDGYFRDEAARLVMLTGAPNINDASRANVHASIRGVAELRQYLIAKRAMADVARKEVEDYQDALVEMRAEEQ